MTAAGDLGILGERGRAEKALKVHDGVAKHFALNPALAKIVDSARFTNQFRYNICK